MRSRATSILSSRPHSSAIRPKHTVDWGKLDPLQLNRAESELQSVEYVPDELILGLGEDRVQGSEALLEQIGGVVVERFESGRSTTGMGSEVVRVKFGENTDLAKALVSLRESPGVAYAEPNQVIRLQEEPLETLNAQAASPATLTQGTQGKRPDDLQSVLWGLHNSQNEGADISAPEAWNVTTGSSNGALIAILDSGADYNHPDLNANIARNSKEIPGDGIDNDKNGIIDDVYGYYAFENTGDPMDGMGHGTHCTGTIAAVGNNSQGIVGVNWQAQVLPVKIFHDRGLTTTDSILRGIAYAEKRGAFVTSNSWGGGQFSQAIHDAFAQSKALHIAAAGNDGQNNDAKPSFPASYDLPNMISVGASDRLDNPSWFSNTGRMSVDLFAPGEEIYSTLPGGAFGVKSGTSMATPHVTGVAGLIASALPQLSTDQVKARLLYSTDPISGIANLAVTGGRLNAAKALSIDETAPAAPNDFGPTQASPREVQLSWTGTGDDGWKNGAATAFEVRVSKEPITPENWNRASLVPTPRGQHIGDHLHARVQQTPQSEAQQVFAGFQAIDEVGNRSSLVTTQAVFPASSVLFKDDFEKEVSDWSADGRWRLVPEAGRGQVWSCKPKGPTEGAFSNLVSPTVDLSEARGAFLRFDSKQDFSWSNNVFVELSNDGGEEWIRLGSLKDRGEWNTHEYDLSAYDGQSVNLRIRSESLGAKDGDGTMIDGFEIVADHPTPERQGR